MTVGQRTPYRTKLRYYKVLFHTTHYTTLRLTTLCNANSPSSNDRFILLKCTLILFNLNELKSISRDRTFINCYCPTSTLNGTAPIRHLAPTTHSLPPTKQEGAPRTFHCCDLPTFVCCGRHLWRDAGGAEKD